MLSVSLCAHFQIFQKEYNLKFIKEIFRYHFGTKNIGLQYSQNDGFDLVGYSNVDYTIYQLDRKITLGTC